MKENIELMIGCFLVTLGLLLAIFVATSCATYPDPRSPQGIRSDIAEQEQRAVYIAAHCPWTVELCMMHPQVCLAADPNEPISFSGSGVIVGKHRVLTANHVLCDGGEFFVIEKDSTIHQAQRIIQAQSRDIAMLMVMLALPDLPPLEYATASDGDVVCTQTAAPSRERKCGKALKVFSSPDNADISHTAKLVPGNSGSGTYDTRGRLVGIGVQLQWCPGQAGKEICGGRSSSVFDLLEGFGLR